MQNLATKYGGALLWLLILVVVSIIASLWPAARCSGLWVSACRWR